MPGLVVSSFNPDDFPPAAVGRYWQDLPAGTRYATEARTITEGMLAGFIGLAGFTEPLFTDIREPQALGYTGQLVPAALTYVVAEGLVLQTHMLHRTGIALLEVQFAAKQPVYVNDTIQVLVDVVESRAASKPDRGVLTSDNHVVNQAGVPVLEYRAIRLVKGAISETLRTGD